MKKTILKVLLSFVILSHTGCERLKREERENLFVIKDQVGRELSFDKMPERIVSLSPSITETIYALGAESKLVGVTTSCDFPEDAKKKEKIGDFFRPSIERILSLKPDVVIMTKGQEEVVKNLSTLRLNVFVLSCESIDEIYDSIKKIGFLVGEERKALEICFDMSKKIDEIKDKLKRLSWKSKPKVFVEIDVNPLVTCGRTSFISEVISIAGGKNIGDEMNVPYGVITQEKVIRENPDIILLLHPLVKSEGIERRIGWEKINAVRNKKVIENIDVNLLSRPGPRIALGIEMLFKIFYQDAGL